MLSYLCVLESKTDDIPVAEFFFSKIVNKGCFLPKLLYKSR